MIVRVLTIGHSHQCASALTLLRLMGRRAHLLPAVADWLNCLAKVDGPAKPKIPVPVSLLKFIVSSLQPERMQDQALKSALCVGYWFLLRASEYLAADSGLFDPDHSISWNDLFFRFTDRAGNVKVGTPQEASKALAQGLEVSATLTLFSNKNRLGTCTRSVVATPGSPLCPVAALLDQHASFKKHVGREPRPEEAIMTKDPEGGVYRRKDISNVLKAAAELADIPGAMVASHSLRRGGASAYVASGASDDDVMRHGRWTSEAPSLGGFFQTKLVLAHFLQYTSSKIGANELVGSS